MSCSTCNKVKVPVSMGHSGLNYTVQPEASPITDRFGKVVDLSQPIAKKPHSPLGGWGVDFFINSIQTHFDGAGPDIVYQNVARTFDLNRIDYTRADLWLNLNIQWLQRVPKKYRRIALSQLMSVAVPLEYQKSSDPHAKVKPFTKATQASLWSLLEIYLCVAQTRFSYSRFIMLAEVVKDLYSPEKSPFSGTASDFQKITLNLENLSDIPTYTIEAARQWMWETMNDLGLFDGNFDQYAAKNLWT
jgi:hypothetical protein